MVLKKPFMAALLLSGSVLPVTSFAGAAVAASFLGRNHAVHPPRSRPDLNSAWVVRGGGSTRVSMSTDAAAEEAAPVSADGETFEFQAAVSRVMDIIINSLYQGAWRLLVSQSIGRQACRQGRKGRGGGERNTAINTGAEPFQQ